MRRVAPAQYHARELDTYQRLNPAPYCASHFGEKLHLDIDKTRNWLYMGPHMSLLLMAIVATAFLPVKNAVAIYDLSLRPLLLTEGLSESGPWARICGVQQSLTHTHP